MLRATSLFRTFLPQNIKRWVADWIFPLVAEMITSMRGCVAHNDLWSWPISSRLFSCDMAFFMDHVAQIQPMRGRCVMYQFQVNRSKSQGHTSHLHFCSQGREYPSRSLIYNLQSFPTTTRDVWIIPFFSNLGLCAACWACFMSHHKLWPISVSHPYSFLNSSLGVAGGKCCRKITVPIFRCG